jgi:hypothetical protein
MAEPAMMVNATSTSMRGSINDIVEFPIIKDTAANTLSERAVRPNSNAQLY